MKNKDVYKENLEESFDEFRSIYDSIELTVSHFDKYFSGENWDIGVAMDDLTTDIKDAIKALNVMLENVEDTYEQLSREDSYDNDWDDFPDEGYLDRNGVWVG